MRMPRKYAKKMTLNSGNIGDPIYGMHENRNDVSALNEKEENPDLNTIHQDMSSDAICVDSLGQATASTASGSPSEDADILLQQPSGSKGRACSGKRKKRRNRKPQRRSAANSKPVCTKKGKRVQTKKISYQKFSGPKLEVYCGEVKGVLFKKEMKKGVHVKCIKDSNGQWFTLPEFEVLGGREKSKSWKRSIKCGGVILEKLEKKGMLPKMPHHRIGKGKAPVHQAPQLQSSDVIGVGGLDKATESTASESPSEHADIQSQQSPGSEDVMVAGEGPQEPALTSETTASQSVASLFSDSVPAAISVICFGGLDQATESTASESPSEHADIQSQQSPGSEDVMVAGEIPQEPALTSETTASQSVASPFSDSVPAAISASNQRTDIPSSLQRTAKQFLNISQEVQMEIQELKNHLNNLEKALDMSDVKQQMSDICQQSLSLITSMEKTLPGRATTTVESHLSNLHSPNVLYYPMQSRLGLSTDNTGSFS